MKYLVALLALVVVGCHSAGEGKEGPQADTRDSVKDIGSTSTAGGQPKEMPGGVGITAGQTGTGTTSGASTGY